MNLVAGVDGGGTGTRALILDRDGTERGRGQGPPGIVSLKDIAAGAEAAADAVEKALEAAIEQVGPEHTRRPLGHLWAGLAGAGDEGVRAAVRAVLEARGLAESVTVTADVDVAYRDAFADDEAGILLVSGTGSVAYGRSAGGEVVRAGGWGALLDDAGSGYRIGLEALRTVLRAHDGRSGPTGLSGPVLSAMDVSSPEHLVAAADRASKARIAGIAPLVFEIADSEDPAAVEIVDEALEEMVALVEAVASRLTPPRAESPVVPGPVVAVHGGLVAPGRPLHARIQMALDAAGFAVRERPVSGARGAARLALERASAR